MRLFPLALLLACEPTGSGTVPTGSGTSSGSTATTFPDGIQVRNGQVVQPHKIVEIDLPVAAPLTLVCTMDGDPEEVLDWSSPDTRDHHELDLLGLAAGEDYSCTVEADENASIDFSFHVPLTDAPMFTVERDASAEMSGVYTLTNNADGCFEQDYAQVVIVDPEGRVRWMYDLGPDLSLDIDASVTPAGRIHAGGGFGLLDWNQPNRGIFRTVELDGTIVNDRSEPSIGLGFNHHSRPMPDGTFVSLTHEWMHAGSRQWAGIGLERWDPAIGAATFTWDTQGMVDAGQLVWAGGDDNPYHANSVTWITDQDGEALLFSLYKAEEIWRIDLATGLRTWKLGARGNFTLLDTDGNELGDDKWFYVQHDPDWTTDGRVLLYDNGYERPGPDYSRAAEFQLDTTAMTATLVWEWTEPGWYNPIVGDADWLDNGNVLVARGMVRCWTPDGNDRTQVVEVDRQTNDVIWRLLWPDRSQSLFRAERYDGCELFANNAKYCKTP